MKPNILILAHIALFTVNLIYGANFIVAKDVMKGFVTPNAFIFLRVAGAGILFWIIRFFVKEKIEKKDYPRLIISGFFGVALNQMLFFNGLSLTSPVNASIIMTFTPVLVAVLSVFILKDPLTPNKMTGLLFGLAGSIFIIMSANSGGLGSSNSTGDIFVLLNATSYSLYLILVKPLMKKYKPITVISWVFLFGFMFVFPLSIKEVINLDFTQFPLSIHISIAFVVLFTTFLAYLLNIFALTVVQPSVSSSYIYFQPITNAFFVWLHSMIFLENSYLGDITWIKILCALLIFIGVYMISKPNKKNSTT